MSQHKSRNERRAFSMVELLVVIGALGMVVVSFCLRPAQSRAGRISCTSHLKQVGLGFVIYVNDNEDRFPWHISTNKGGTLEWGNTADVYRHFRAISNELATPKVLVCPTDKRRTPALRWEPDRNLPQDPVFGPKHLSYFAGLDAKEGKPALWLSGDRNISGGTSVNPHLMLLVSNSVPKWGSDIHHKSGNLGLSDGSVQQLSNSGLALAHAEARTNLQRLAIP